MGYEGRGYDGQSNGGADGVIMAIAIAIVLFFVIRIYSDYSMVHRSPAAAYGRHKKNGPPPDSADTRRAPVESPTLPRSKRPQPLFEASQPYPAALTDVQVGDRLSELFNADLPVARRDHNVFSFHPAGGPFKTVTCLLEGGANDPPVVGITYLYRSRKAYETVRSEALTTFGDAETSAGEQGESLKWIGINQCTVQLDPDRYSVEKEWAHDAGDSNPRPRDETLR